MVFSTLRGLDVPASVESPACMKGIQYTVREVPKEVDRALRALAKREGKSLNTTVLDALRRSSGLSGTPPINHDFDDIAGKGPDDPEFMAAIAEMRSQIDEALWK